MSIAVPNFEHWELLQNSFKPYACHLVHPLPMRHAPSTSRRSRSHACVPLSRLWRRSQITGGAGGKPNTALAAKFDLKHCIALALHGRTLSAADFLEPWQPDPAILATAAGIAPESRSATGFASARLDAELLDGAPKSSIIVTAKGHPANPMTWDDMWVIR
ncbi:MAG: hypothetical protein R3D67_12685 [Hyphomicrobiaceae bacterium]